MGLLREFAAGGLGAVIRGAERATASLREIYRKITGEPAPMRPFESADGQQPAVPVEMSVTPNYIVCLEDGLRFKMLKGHLRAAYGMTPEDYRDKWGLPADYPMVAPNYREKRIRMAKEMGLGHMRGRSRARGKPGRARGENEQRAA